MFSKIKFQFKVLFLSKRFLTSLIRPLNMDASDLEQKRPKAKKEVLSGCQSSLSLSFPFFLSLSFSPTLSLSFNSKTKTPVPSLECFQLCACLRTLAICFLSSSIFTGARVRTMKKQFPGSGKKNLMLFEILGS